MRITREFIKSFSTDRGGFTRVQMAALGEPWPAASGWIGRAVEREHSAEAIDIFKKAASRSFASKVRKQVRSAVKKSRRLDAEKALQEKLFNGRQTPAKPEKRSPAAERYAGDPNGTDFLQSFQWRKLRMEVLRRYGPVCMCCGASAKTGATIHVDHIKPRRKYPQLALSFENLQILCHECNHGKGNWDETDWRPVDDAIDPEVAAFIKSIANER